MIKYIALLLFGILLIIWWNTPVYVAPGHGQVAPLPIKKAILKMGPYYDYRLLPDKTLQVQLNGKWRRLRY